MSDRALRSELERLQARVTQLRATSGPELEAELLEQVKQRLVQLEARRGALEAIRSARQQEVVASRLRLLHAMERGAVVATPSQNQLMLLFDGGKLFGVGFGLCVATVALALDLRLGLPLLWLAPLLLVIALINGWSRGAIERRALAAQGASAGEAKTGTAEEVEPARTRERE